jgi:hypothetical protein
MRTTTIVFRFTAEASQEVLSTKMATYNARMKPILSDFVSLHGISDDNLVSEDVNHETCLRTVVRTWPSLEIATAWVAASLETRSWLTDYYPGTIISAQVDPE